MDNKKKVIIEVTLDDKASTGLGKLQSNTKKASIDMGSAFKKVALAATGVTVAIAGATAGILKMGERVGKIEGLSVGFERNFGDMEKALGSFRKASQGMVSDMDLMQTANKAALLGVTDDIDKLSELMVTARLRGREMGLDMTQAFDDIVTGIGRGSPLILDNLGIKIPDAVKKSMESMGEAEKTQALLNFAIQDGATIAAEYGEVQLTAGEKVAILKAKMVNLKDETLVNLTPAIEGAIEKMSEFANKLAKTATELVNGTTPAARGLQWALADETEGLGPALKRTGFLFNDLINTITGEENVSGMDNFTTMIAGWAFLLGKVADALSVVITLATKAVQKMTEYESKYYSGVSGGGNNKYSPGPSGGGFASGGIVSGGMTLVGERGPEIVSLPRGSHVFNNEDTKRMGESGDTIINVNGTVYGVDNLKATILEAMNEATARQNRLANYNLL